MENYCLPAEDIQREEYASAYPDLCTPQNKALYPAEGYLEL